MILYRGEPDLVNVHVWIVISSLKSPSADKVVTHSKKHQRQAWISTVVLY